jgi:lipopolysaccharide/colanic/teichoic acid biosynthesis glycosyltransferase
VTTDEVASVTETQEIPAVATTDERSSDSKDVGATVIDLRSGDPVIRLEPTGAERSRARSPYVRFVKPVVDLALGTVALVVSAPIILLVAVAIRATMGKGVLFRQPRVGRGGKVFDVLKFRTMAMDRRADQVLYVGPERRENHKSADDPRHTRFGRFLRRWSLDELPQFLNVIRGDMSMVGPRPELVSVVGKYEPWQHDRHQVRPGITGIWQVSERNDIPLHEATHLDIEYIETVSFSTDIKILLKTVPAMLGRSKGK